MYLEVTKGWPLAHGGRAARLWDRAAFPIYLVLPYWRGEHQGFSRARAGIQWRQMASSMVPIKATPPEPLPRPEDHVFQFVNRFRPLILTSPLWLAALTLAVNYVGNESIRNVVRFLTAPLR